MLQDESTEKRVKAANRKFYDLVGDSYEQIDGRRSPAMEAWVRKNLNHLREQSTGGYLLDLGTGSGLVTRCAEGLFSRRVGIDLSPGILGFNRQNFDLAVAGDVDILPFRDHSFDVVTSFALLHHLFSFEGLVAEVARILRPGGIFYSDHDLDAAFSKRFHPLLKLYRKLHNAESKYHKMSMSITKELYQLAEWQENGVDPLPIVNLLQRQAFSVKTNYHWYGLGTITNRIFGERSFPRGLAPLFSIVAFSSK